MLLLNRRTLRKIIKYNDGNIINKISISIKKDCLPMFLYLHNEVFNLFFTAFIPNNRIDENCLMDIRKYAFKYNSHTIFKWLLDKYDIIDNNLLKYIKFFIIENKYTDNICLQYLFNKLFIFKYNNCVYSEIYNDIDILKNCFDHKRDTYNIYYSNGHYSTGHNSNGTKFIANKDYDLNHTI
jgi:hypothetical protein